MTSTTVTVWILLAGAVMVVMAVSALLHGITVTPLMKRYGGD